MRNIAIAIAVSAACASGAAAAEIDVDELQSEGSEDSYAIQEAAPPDDSAVGPRVYGWAALRPPDCGTFKYWNRDYCADARIEPPASADDED